MCLRPEFWAERQTEWTNHFVTMAKRLSETQIIHRHVPVNPEEYNKNPTEWPRGTIGETLLFG